MPPKECHETCTGRCNRKLKGTATAAATSTGGGSKLGEASHVIFNLDGVLLDTDAVYAKVIQTLMTKYGKQAGIASKYIDMQHEATSVFVVQDSKLPVSPEEFLVQFRSTAVKELRNAPLMAGADRLVEHLRKNGVHIAVASACNQEAFDLKTTNHKSVFGKFDHILLAGSDPEVTEDKPSPQLYKVCGSRFADKPDLQKCLAIEDEADGVNSALGAGMKVVWIPNKYADKQAGKDATLTLNSLQTFKPDEFGLPKL